MFRRGCFKRIIILTDNVEIAVPLEDILKILGWSRSKFFQKAGELRDLGVIFYRKEPNFYKPRIRAFPSRIHRYIHEKSRRGHVL